MTLYLGAEPVSVDHIEQVLSGDLSIALSDSRGQQLSRGFEFIQQRINASDTTYYGINTGFGDLCDHRIAPSDLLLLQDRLIRSHACGTGAEVPESIARLILFLKIENISQGYSGVSPALVDHLLAMYASGISPVVYEQGSLGASGDLAPLAHLGMSILGEGKSYFRGSKIDTVTALDKAGLSPYTLQAKEGLAILNGTQFSTAYSLYGWVHGYRLWRLANHVAALSMDAFECLLSPFDERIQELRPHAGQGKTAAAIRQLLTGREAPSGPAHKVQDPYAFRCIPQVHGASWDTLDFARRTLEVEINAVTDNPLIFPESEGILSGGNFHAQPIALASDYLAIALAELGSISERRTFQLISGERDLPPFLSVDPGLNSGLMISQYTAASIASQNKQLCTPASVDSIVSSNGQEDHVSMAANAGTKLYRVVDNVYRILAIEWMTAAQAMSFRRPRRSSPRLEEWLRQYREEVPFLESDRYLAKDIAASVSFLQNVNV